MMATPTSTLSVAPGRKTLQDTIKEIETQIALLGPGPHNAKQQEDLAKLKDLHTRALAEQEKLKSAKSQYQQPIAPIAITQTQVQPQLQQPIQVQPQVTVIPQTQPLQTAPSTTAVPMVNILKPAVNTTSATLPILGTTVAQQLTTTTTQPVSVTMTRPNSVPGASTTVSVVNQGRISPESNQILTKRRLQDLVKEVDPNEQLDEDVEELLLQIADDFVESVVTAACQLAKHRKANTVEVKDVQLHLERNWNMWLPGFGTDEVRPYKKSTTTEAHKQRLALIRKTLKK
ncbi:transcription initiation factor TFIID subunit 12-like [Ptychodera flava]|uniref:transcription initiation factor TFIID subunit 12-like n=1 Tax=Ptychodera flava TaxID=63121 RepID=UPI00396A6470